jgi:hypothetical protein
MEVLRPHIENLRHIFVFFFFLKTRYLKRKEKLDFWKMKEWKIPEKWEKVIVSYNFFNYFPPLHFLKYSFKSWIKIISYKKQCLLYFQNFKEKLALNFQCWLFIFQSTFNFKKHSHPRTTFILLLSPFVYQKTINHFMHFMCLSFSIFFLSYS